MTENRSASFLQTISHALVVGAGVLYIFGFIIVTAFDASYGISDFSLFRTKVIAVGCLFVFLLALPVVVAFRTFKILGLGRRVVYATKISKPENMPFLMVDIATSLPFTCTGLLVVPLGFLYVTPFRLGDRGFISYILVAAVYATSAILSRDRFDKHPTLFLCISLIITTGYFVVLYRYADRELFWLVVWLSSVSFVTVAVWYWMRNPEEIRTTEWERLLLFLIPVIFGVYALKLYPKIKPQYGGGAPVPIVLHLTRKLPVFDSETVPVSLVDETEQGYYVLRGSDKAVFVARGLVEEVEFLRDVPVTSTNAKKP